MTFDLPFLECARCDLGYCAKSTDPVLFASLGPTEWFGSAMLKISKLTDYGLLASIYLARHRGEKVSAREVAEFCHLPVPAISKVLKMLLEGGIITSFRGAGGGYSLETDPETITLAKLIEALEGPWELVECETIDDAGHAVCGIRQACPSRSVMFGINRVIKRAFEQVTLSDLVRGGQPALVFAQTERQLQTSGA